MSRSHRVVITGIGLVTPLGVDTPTTWQGLIEGRSGIKKLPEHFNMGDYPVSVAGLVTGEKPLLDQTLPAKFHSKTDRFIQLAVIAGHHAMTDANLTKTFPENRERFGVYMGVGVGGLGGISDAVLGAEKSGLKSVSPFTITKIVNSLAPAWLSMQWNLQGSELAIGNACASSTDAVGLAFRMIRDGYADYMLAGGTESCIIPLSLAGFGNMRTLSTWPGDGAQASRPFDRQRSGFVMGEGAAVLVLERADLAEQRGAPIYAEVVGYGATADAYHITAMHPEGHGAKRAIQIALDDAKITPEQVGYVNAHGTSTVMNDATESYVLKEIFTHTDPSLPEHLLVSSTKSMTGHMLGATGAAEAAFSALALKHQLFPPTINCSDPDIDGLDYIPHTARAASVEYAISNSFGFGGGNAVVVLKKA